MRVRLVAVGRLKAGPERELAERYQKRAVEIGRTLGCQGPDVVELAEGRSRAAPDRMADEGARIARETPDATLVMFDERAPSPTSQAFAARLGQWRDGGIRDLALVLGGPDGLSPDLRARADWAVSFGAMTLPHGLARVLALEQLYRALTILAGHPYHRDGLA